MKLALVYDAVYPYVVGGAEHRYYALARRWREQHRVSIVGFNYWSDDPTGLLDGCQYHGVAPAVPLYDARGRRRMGEALYFSARLIPWLVRSDDDLWDIGSFPYLSVLVARAVGAVRRRLFVVTWLEYWDDYWVEYLGRWAFVGRWVERLAARSSPYIIAISQRTRARLIAAGYPEGRVVAIPIGVDLAVIDDVPPQPAKYDLVYAGRLVAHKQVELLIEAAAILKDRGRAVRVGIVGDGPERARLTALATDIGVQNLVTFLGRVATEQDVFAHLKSGRVLVAPSKREGFGMAVVQGWACGVPAVVCDEPLNALADLVDEPFKGRVVRSEALAVASACAALLEEQSDQRRAQLRRAADRFRWEPIADEILEVYRRVVDGAPSLTEGESPAPSTARSRSETTTGRG